MSFRIDFNVRQRGSFSMKSRHSFSANFRLKFPELYYVRNRLFLFVHDGKPSHPVFEHLSVQSLQNLDENASSLFGVQQMNVSFDNSRRQNVSAGVSIVSGCTVNAAGPSMLRGKVLSYDKSKFSRTSVRKCNLHFFINHVF